MLKKIGEFYALFFEFNTIFLIFFSTVFSFSLLLSGKLFTLSIIQFPVYLWVFSTKVVLARMAELCKFSRRLERKMDPYVDSELLTQIGGRSHLRLYSLVIVINVWENVQRYFCRFSWRVPRMEQRNWRRDIL